MAYAINKAQMSHFRSYYILALTDICSTIITWYFEVFSYMTIFFCEMYEKVAQWTCVSHYRFISVIILVPWDKPLHSRLSKEDTVIERQDKTSPNTVA